MHERVAEVSRICGHQFNNTLLVESALTHPSAVEGKPVSACYERLEFLGDSILGAIVAKDLYERFPDMDEGQLTQMKIALVSGKMLSTVASGLGVSKLVVIGDSEKGTGERGLNHILEDVFEAIVGALYLDAGYDAAHDFVRRTLGPQLTPSLAKKPISPKSRLQEVVQRDFHCGPAYELVGEDGPAHEPTFTSVVFERTRRIGRGSGPSKKASESAAAINALVNLGYATEEDFEGAGITN